MNNSLNINIPKMVTSSPYLRRAINCNSSANRVKIESEITKQNILAQFETFPSVSSLLKETVGSLKLYPQESSNEYSGIQLSKPQSEHVYLHQSCPPSRRLVSLSNSLKNRLSPMVSGNLTTLSQPV